MPIVWYIKMVHLLHKQYQNYIFPLLKVSKSVGHGEIACSFISLVLWLCFWRRSRWWQNRSPLSRYIKGTMLNFWVCALIPITNIEEGNQISLILKPIESYYMFLYRVFFQVLWLSDHQLDIGSKVLKIIVFRYYSKLSETLFYKSDYQNLVVSNHNTFLQHLLQKNKKLSTK